MARFFIPILVVAGFAFSLLPSPLHAGDDGVPAPRREFRQSNAYPFTFVPISYLATGGPKGMRFSEPQAQCSHRDAPPLPAATPAPTSEPASETPEKKGPAPVTTPAPANPTPTPVAPAFPPPTNAPTAGGPDLTTMPEEVMNYFKNPYNSSPRGPHLFDPIFEPGYHQGPTSKATYQLSDKP